MNEKKKKRKETQLRVLTIRHANYFRLKLVSNDRKKLPSKILAVTEKTRREIRIKSLTILYFIIQHAPLFVRIKKK